MLCSHLINFQTLVDAPVVGVGIMVGEALPTEAKANMIIGESTLVMDGH